MDIVRSFTFVFEDKDWVAKLLIAAGILLVGSLFAWLLLIPLIAAIALLTGYSLEITRRVIHGHPQPLPEWDNWGGLLTDGLKGLAIVLVYFLPLILLSLCLGVPTVLFNSDSSLSLQQVGTLLGLFTSCLDFLWIIAASLLLPVAFGFYVAEGEIRAAFSFGRVWAFFRDHISIYLITLLMSWVAAVIGDLGSLVCGLGWFVTMPYSWMVTGHLYGQAYLEAGGQALPPALAGAEEAA